jgi:hypothetical protein
MLRWRQGGPPQRTERHRNHLMHGLVLLFMVNRDRDMTRKPKGKQLVRISLSGTMQKLKCAGSSTRCSYVTFAAAQENFDIPSPGSWAHEPEALSHPRLIIYKSSDHSWIARSKDAISRVLFCDSSVPHTSVVLRTRGMARMRGPSRGTTQTGAGVFQCSNA